jgi:hypothetical protein
MLRTIVEKARHMFALVRRFISNWSHDRVKALHASSKFTLCSEIEVARIALARDAGMSVAELCSIDMRGPKAADLLLRRMATLHHDPEEVARLDPAAARDLQRVCILCTSRRRCAKDLERNAPPETWKPYCANSGMLAALNSTAPVYGQ